MLKKTLAIILTTSAIFSLSACSLLDDDYITESETESITETEVITTVYTTVNTTELLATEVGSSKEATIEDNFIMTDNSPNTEASDVSGEYVGTDEYAESSHTVSELDTTVWDVSDLIKPTLIESTEETIGTTKEEDSFSNYIDIAVETPVTDFQYETSSEGDCIYLTKYIGTDETVIIPSQIDGLPVVSLKGISGNGYISEGVFEGTSVKKVVIPEGVTSIGLRAFKGCTELSEISVPKTLNKLVNNAFENCVKLESIDLSDTIVTSLGMSAFSGCTNLKEIKFPDSLVKIEKMVFLNCSSLIELRLPPNLTEVEEGAINNCTALTTITVPPSLNMMSFDIPLPVYNAPSLEEIIFDEGREEINGYYFFAITSNAEIIIPKSVKRFSSYPFFIDADAKIVFLGNCPEIIETEEFIGNPTIYYDPSTEGWNECKWKDKYVLTPIE